MTALSFSDPKSSRTRRPAIDLYAKHDPSKTNAVRARFEREMVRRFRKVRDEARTFIEDDQLKLFASSDKVENFMRWLRRAQDREVLEISRGTRVGNTRWSDLYLRSAYQKGLAQAYSRVRADGIEVEESWIKGAFFRPIHADRAGLIYTRAYTDLEGITRNVDSRLSGILAEGIIEGVGVKELGKRVSEGIESIGVNRSRVIARTEVIRAHAEATLNSYEEAGMEGVEVESEFSTSNDNKVCPKCNELEGETYTLEDARGVIPVHPNCRCAWIPVVSEKSRGRKIG